MPFGTESQRQASPPLWATYTRRRTTMNRKGLWAGGVALILLVVGAAVLLTTVGAGYAKNEDASKRAKCSNATLKGTYLFAQNGVEIKGNEQRPFAIAGYDVFDGNGEVKGLASGNFNGQTFVTSPALGRIRSRRIAQAPSPLRMARVTTCSSPLMAHVYVRAYRPRDCVVGF